MAQTMLDKQAESSVKSPWPPEIAAEFEREKNNPNPCVGNALVSESDRVRVWTIRLRPGQRIGFHRHVLDYFWTAVTGGRGRQHVHDGTTVEYTYAPGETRHETYGPGEFKVHDLENLGDKEMVFMTIEFLQSANNRCYCPNACGSRPQRKRRKSHRPLVLAIPEHGDARRAENLTRSTQARLPAGRRRQSPVATWLRGQTD